MEKYMIYAAAILVFLAVVVFYLVTANKRKRRRLLTKIRMAYGKLPDREYTDVELKKIRTYFDKVHDPNGYFVDDITWNDLDMDSIYIAMNHTFSSVGEEVLYDILREPVFSAEILHERERLIRFFMEHKEVREQILMDYASIGRTQKVSLVQFLEQFKELQLKDAISYYAHVFAIVIAIVVMIIEPTLGILALIGVVIFNIVTYFRDKAGIEPYYVSLSAMAYLAEGALKIAAHKEPELSAYTEALKKEVSHVKPLLREMKWIGRGMQVGGSGDLTQIFMDYVRMLTHIDFVHFNRMARAVLNNEEHIMELMRLMGTLEAMIAVGSYRQTIPFYCKGKMLDEKSTAMHLKNGYHPLIKAPVANSLYEDGPVLITGSNASGKSTFLRMTALAALMAQTVNTVHASEYRAGFFRIYSSMALRDDIQSSESYYIVEIKSIKRIMDAVDGEYPVLMFVDEVLRGTNTVERIAASSQILKIFAERGAMVFAATHDIELTHLLEDIFRNYHFEEEIVDREVRFNYILRKGRAVSRNAIKLLSVMGYDDAVIERAEATAQKFVSEGVWTLE